MESDFLAWEEMRVGWAEHTRARSRYKFEARANDTAEITIYGPIGQDFFGDGITGVAFQKEMKKLQGAKCITVRIDSPGGVVSDARTIYSLLVESTAKVDVVIDGMAASAASVVAMAGDSIAIAEGGFMMIHEARGVARGTAADMTKASEILLAITDSIADTYVSRTSNSAKKVRDWMRVETWFNGRQAVDAGFADSVIANKVAPRAYAYADAFESFPRKLLPKSTRARSLMRKIERIANDARSL
jgi:ATP-dependent protease ClpP protease subunit